MVAKEVTGPSAVFKEPATWVLAWPSPRPCFTLSRAGDGSTCHAGGKEEGGALEREAFNRLRSPGARAWWGARAEPWAPMVGWCWCKWNTVPGRQLPANYSWVQPGLNAALPQKIHRTELCRLSCLAFGFWDGKYCRTQRKA